jgi:hypothetical protein
MDEFLLALKWFILGLGLGYLADPLYKFLNKLWHELKGMPEEWKNGKSN